MTNNAATHLITKLASDVNSFFKSKKLALFLIFILIVIFGISYFFPQVNRVSEFELFKWHEDNPLLSKIDKFTSLTSIYNTWYFYIVLSLFFLNVLFCTFPQITKAFKIYNKPVKKIDWARLRKSRNYFEFTLEKEPQAAKSMIASNLKRKLFSTKIYKRKDRIIIVAEKFRLSNFSLVVFHVCLVLMILLILMSRLTRMEGQAPIIEGKTFIDQKDNYLALESGPLWKEKYQNFELSLVNFEPLYLDDDGDFRGWAGRVRLFDQGQEIKSDYIYSNKPLSHRGSNIYAETYGFAPLFQIYNKQNEKISESYIYLIEENKGNYQNSFDIGELDFNGVVTFNKAKIKTRAAEQYYLIPEKPKINLTLEENNKKIFEGQIKIGEKVAMGPYLFKFDSMEYFAGFVVVRDPYLGWVFNSWWLMLVSLLATYLIIPKRIYAVIYKEEDYTQVKLHGQSPRNKLYFREQLEKLADKWKEKN